MAKRKSRRRSRRARGYTTGAEKAKVGGCAAALGYVETQTDYMARVPILSEQGTGTKAYALIALAAHVGAKKFRSRWADRFGAAAASIAGYKLGQNNMQLQGDGDLVEGVAGWEDAIDADEVDEISGEL